MHDLKAIKIKELEDFFFKKIVFCILIVFSAVLCFIVPNFLSWQNLLNIAISCSVNGVMACGMAFVIISGGIDISIGSLLALGSAVCVGTLGIATSGRGIVPNLSPYVSFPWPMAKLAGIAVPALLGSGSGLFITRMKLQPFIVTLAMQSIARGLTYIFGDFMMHEMGQGTIMVYYHPVFNTIGNGRLLGIPIPILFFLGAILVSSLILNSTSYGRALYAIGGNEEISNLAGINVKRIKVITYAVMGGVAGLAGILLASRLSASTPLAGLNYEMDVIAAVAIGGVSMTGGYGKLAGVVVGVFLLGVITNGLNMANVPSFYQYVIKGMILIFAVALDTYYKGRLEMEKGSISSRRGASSRSN